MRFRQRVFRAAVLSAALSSLFACGPQPEQAARPLLDEEHGAEVLTEQRVLSHPRSVEQNRLLRGWRYFKLEDRLEVRPVGPEAVVELVNLVPRARDLVIEFDKAPLDGLVGALIDGRDLGKFPIAEKVAIPLPDDLPAGRVAVALAFPDPESCSISRVSASPVLPAGEAEIAAGTITQHGWSAVEVVRRIGPNTRLAARFQPPENAEADQRFSITVERSPGGTAQVFSWNARTAADSDVRPIEIGFGPDPGIVRIRFLARGRGPAARWIEPRIIDPGPAAARSRETEIPDPPRLVILYVMDALRADHVRSVGPTGPLTPVINRLADQGARFDTHFAVAPNTAPSTRALITGLVMLDDRQLPDPGPVRIADVFRDAGYRTSLVTGNPNLGPELDLAVGFDTVDLLPVTEDHHPDHPPTINRSAEILHEAAIVRLDDLSPDDRAFLYIHTMNPHNPYTPPPQIETRLAPSGPSVIDGRTRTLVEIRDQTREVSSADMNRIRQLYAAGVAYNDHELGRFLDAIDRRFPAEDVLLVVTSDHGEELFEHGGVLHGYTQYDEMLRIPLVVHWPGRVRASTVANPTTTLDLHATLVELATRRHDGPNGASLWPVMSGTWTAVDDGAPTFAAAPGLDGAVMARSARWKLVIAPRDGVRRGQGHGRGRNHDLESVFDLESDPGEQRNLAGDADLEVAWLRSRLAGWVATQQALQPEPGDREINAATREQLEALGYVVD